MLFNSLEFLLFLPVVLAGYYVLSLRGQNLWLLIASYVFYAAWDWRFLLLIFISTLTDFLVAQKLTAAERKRAWLTISLVVNLGMLGVFKYFNFFVDNFIALGAAFGLNFDTVVMRLLPPVGISFYTFQTLSYTIDVYRGKVQPERCFTRFALFVSYFPQLVAGPIERAQRLMPQISSARVISVEHIASGLTLIMIGLFKKVVIADNAGATVDRIFAAPGEMSWAVLVHGLLLFALQIYGDFSGYSNIARGVSRLFGIELMENFKTPYFAMNVSEFWRRWHISLSEWLRDYLYISLGGNRGGTLRTYRNLGMTMLLGGLWHGASWNFVIWGALHGGYLIVHRLYQNCFQPRQVTWMYRCCAMLLTFIAVTLAWLFFRAETFDDAITYLLGIITLRGEIELAQIAKFFVLAAAIAPIEITQYRANGDVLAIRRWTFSIRLLAYLAMIFAILLFGTQDAPFIYFQF